VAGPFAVVVGGRAGDQEGDNAPSVVVHGELRVNEALELVAWGTAGVEGMAAGSPVDRTAARRSSRSSGLAEAGTEARETPALVTAVAGDG